jgi:hypothetical protein
MRTGEQAWVNTHYPGFRVARDFLPVSEEACDYYRTFAGRFLLLWSEAQEARPGTSIKEIDHFLWEDAAPAPGLEG